MTITHENKSITIKWIITFAIPVIFFCIPTNADYTSSIQIFLAITAFIIIIIAFDLLVASIMMPTLYLLCGVAPMQQAFGAWTNMAL